MDPTAPSNISPETLTQLHNLAVQKIQSDILIDQTWMTYNPYIIAGLGIIFLGTLIIILANELIAYRSGSHDNSDTRVWVNITCIVCAFLCLIAIIGFSFGLSQAYGDYIFKTKSPEAAIYQTIISYLYYGVYR